MPAIMARGSPNEPFEEGLKRGHGCVVRYWKIDISAATKVEGSLIAMASHEICVLFHGSQIVLVDGADSTGVRKGSKRLIGRMDRDRSAA